MAWCKLQFKLFVFACVSCCAWSADRNDLQRAKTKKPRSAYQGEGQEELSRVLNGHLLKSERGVVRACANWTAKELQGFMLRVLQHRSPELNRVYHNTDDRRKLQKAALTEYQNHWENVNDVVHRSPHLHKPLRDSHCREAVMWWTHHLSEDARRALRKEVVTVPMLPEEPKAECRASTEDAGEGSLCVGAEQANSCDWCHSLQSERNQTGKHAPNALLPQYVGPDDGNPHGWDRKRRCDQDYKSPPCGICEGIGGVAWSDKNEDIHMTTCVPLKLPHEVDMSTVTWPVYPKAFTHSKYKDVLIGRKTDPFCFGFFPENNSSGTECYRAEDGIMKYYDIDKEAVRTDYNLKLSGAFGYLPNITSTVTHVGKYMWIVNKMWLGLTQCICTDPGRDKCTHAPNCSSYAWHYNFADTAQYLGRERLGVEWIGEMELDHFILWSHHMWTDPKTKRLVRLWKPWNGLQVYHPDFWQDSISDASVFEVPPPQCKKGFAKITIHCDEHGNFNPGMSSGLELLEQLQREAESRAKTQLFV